MVQVEIGRLEGEAAEDRRDGVDLPVGQIDLLWHRRG